MSPRESASSRSRGKQNGERGNREHETRAGGSTEEEKMAKMARAAIAAVQASESNREQLREERRQYPPPSRLEALKVVERKIPDMKFEG